MADVSDFDLVVRGNIVDADAAVQDGWIGIRDGRVAARGQCLGGADAPMARDRVDARGLWIVPGVVDGQVHAASQANQEGLGHASRAAAAGGVTTMVDMLHDDPEPVACRASLDAKIAEVERDCHVDVALYADAQRYPRAGRGRRPDRRRRVRVQALDLEASPGRFPRVEEDLLYEAFRLIAPRAWSQACTTRTRN